MDSMDKQRAAEQWLDAALNEFSKTEPRAGLEKRVLASLEAERKRLATRRRWWWAAGLAAAAAAVVMAAWIGRSGERNSGTPAVETMTAHHEAVPTIPPAPVTHASHRQPKARQLRNPAVEDMPKLSQFPSPQPLSEQERILASYVANYPQHAALIAQARAEALRRDRAEEMGAPASAEHENSQQRIH